ncbi:MAG: hypothetical protein Q8Q88_11125 [Phenylobacterium sp.]|uniref:hypothetical protein n=1 Tax=Phenylobacterium sp. TaxID=1871053 RepID=UPI0027334781|nr:hypothetical protein [Phenylobacterium sp.]MDP3747584.1 hypothetical protein [Phenylobacterium sp.]
MVENAAITATAFYKDPMAALHWSGQAFGARIYRASAGTMTQLTGLKVRNSLKEA